MLATSKTLNSKMSHPNGDLSCSSEYQTPNQLPYIPNLQEKLENPNFKITKKGNRAYNASTSKGKNCKAGNYTVAQNPSFAIQN